MTTARSALLVLAALGCAGCAEIRLRTTPVIASETVLQGRRETVIGPEVAVQVEQAGSRVTLTATRMCAVHAVRDVRRAVRYAHYDANAGGTKGMGITGGVLAAVGGLLTALPAMPVNTSHGADLGFGIPMAALGTTLAVAAIVGVVRASKHEERIEDTTVDDGPVTASAPCDRHRPAMYEGVIGKVAGVAVPLGKTDDDGKLTIDLTRLPPAALGAIPAPLRLSLFLHEVEVATVSLEALARAAEACIGRSCEGGFR